MVLRRYYLTLVLLLAGQIGSTNAVNFQSCALSNPMHTLMSKGSSIVGYCAGPFKYLGRQIHSLVTLVGNKCPIIKKHPILSLTTLTVCSAALACFAKPIIRFFKDKLRRARQEAPDIETPAPDVAATAPQTVQPIAQEVPAPASTETPAIAQIHSEAPEPVAIETPTTQQVQLDAPAPVATEAPVISPFHSEVTAQLAAGINAITPVKLVIPDNTPIAETEPALSLKFDDGTVAITQQLPELTPVHLSPTNSPAAIEVTSVTETTYAATVAPATPPSPSQHIQVSPAPSKDSSSSSSSSAGAAESSAAQSGTLFIQNDHPAIQFKCTYQINGKEKCPITIYKGEVELGPVASITDIAIERYGDVLGTNASSYNFSGLLSKCTKQPNRDWVLHITWSAVQGWLVDARLKEQSAEQTALTCPLDYFAKASTYGGTPEPRHLLDLPKEYTHNNVTERQEDLTRQIKAHSLTRNMEQQVLLLLDTAADYAHRFLDLADKASPEYQKLTLEWRGKLHPERVARGKQLAHNLLDGNALPSAQQTPAQYLNNIIDLAWFFYSGALAKNQAFEEGTFIIQDAQHTFYNFLMYYVKKVNPDIKDAFTDPELMISHNPFAYSRASTHFTPEQRQFRHYGIDIRFGDSSMNLAQALLPAQKTHLMFGHISNGLLFIKFENIGIATQSVVNHGAELVVARTRKLLPKVEGYFPKSIDDFLVNYLGMDDDPNYRKERVPVAFSEACKQILKSEEKLSQSYVESLIQDISTQGIHRVLYEIENTESPLTQAQKTGLGESLEQLANQGLDHQEIRYGREVILTHDELSKL